MSKTLILKAPAKINLTLDVLEKRPDGYHELETVMQTVDLCDKILLYKTDSGIRVTSNQAELESGRGNLAYRAAESLKHLFNGGIHIHLEKNIPLAAGLAGGSADAAAVLKGINTLFRLGLSTLQLRKLGSSLGADVPFCLLGGTALARGIGEKLEVLPSPGVLWLVLVKPSYGVSTAEVYAAFKPELVARRPDTKNIIKALAEGRTGFLVSQFHNVLEYTVIPRYPEIGVIKEKMIQAGACCAVLCGSGPTVFGITETEKDAQKVAAEFKQKYDKVYITRTF